MDNIVNDLPHKNKFEICLKNIIIIQLRRHFFLQRQILKNIDISQQKPRHLPTAEANFKPGLFFFFFFFAERVFLKKKKLFFLFIIVAKALF